MRSRPISLLFGLLALLSFAVAIADSPTPTEPDASIEYMLARVASSDVLSVRNGKSHTATKWMHRLLVEYRESQNALKAVQK